MKLLFNLVKKDFLKNKVITTALAIFLILSTLLMAGGLSVTGTMISSLNGLNKIAITPHFLQMHKGAYDDEAFKKFVSTHEYIKSSIIVKMLNIKNSNIIYKAETLEKSLMDNGFVLQNKKFDFLLNMDNEIAIVNNSEIGVPVYYSEELGIKVGDVITLLSGDFSKELTVSTIIRDSTMNAALSSSKRFLINQATLDEISLHLGEWEYCFEFLLKEDASMAVLQKDYIDAGLPKNGVSVTGSLLTMLNGLSYGLVAFIIIAISVLLIMISVLCLSYIIRATMAEENYTLGEMKAIGLSRKSIGKLYQMKYTILIVAAGIIGYLSSMPFGNFFSSSVIKYCGNGTQEWIKWIFPLIGIILLSLFVMFRCQRIIRASLKNTVVELFRGEEKIKKEGHYKLPKKGLKHRNLSIALGELKCQWKEYVVIFLVFVLSSLLILIPMNMKNTIENPSFITYMGVAKCDIRIDIQYTVNLEEQKQKVISYLEKDTQVEKFEIYRYGYVQLQNSKGEWEHIRTQSGDYSQFPLEYLDGNKPVKNREIALSYMNASGLEKKVGDELPVIYKGQEVLFTVCGIYQDVTYGGKTAKTVINFDENEIEVYIIYLNLYDGVSIEEKTDDMRLAMTDSKITPISEFVSQTLGGITNYMSLVEIAAIIISMLLILLITVMILQLITAREHSGVAIKKAIGFSNRDIRIQFGIRILLVQITAIVVGTILANSLGEVIFGWILSFMGASKITMIVEPVNAYLIFPAVQLFIVFITVIFGTKVVKSYHIRNQIMD